MSSPTDQQLLDAYRNALMACSANQAYQVAGRTFTRADLPEIRKTIDWLEDRIADDTNPMDGTGILYATFRGRDLYR